MRFSEPGGFGIKMRSWFGGRRPAFMEPLGVPPPNGGSKRALASEDVVSGVGYGGGGDTGGGLARRFRSSSSSFPIKDDAGYIGYLTDDEQEVSGDSTVARRRRELIGSDADVSFSNCMFMMITVCGLLMLFLFAVSPWGVPPPRRL